jgi:tRNA-2-methylthio-N6-dimethylallyladenosine synthase
MAKRYLIETFGCQMNDLDSEKIAGNLRHHGMEPAEDASQADVIILNTCSVREKAVQKVYARLGEIKQHKVRRQDLIVGVVGCMAQLEGAKILKRAPFVSILAGPQKGSVLGDLVERCSPAQGPIIDMRTDEAPAPLETAYILRQNPLRASVTISEGCNRQCSFCIVPLTRGRERVRESANILREVESLVARGYVEIVLLGQTVNSYVDRTVENMNFARLLRQMAGIAGLKRIRFTSPHPSDFSDELLDVMVSCPQVCNQIHLPVQSGSTRILRAMRRGYTRESYLAVIDKIRNGRRSIALSTDIIVGFPGESEEDFQDTLSLLDEVQYDCAFSFKYSPRPNTAALNLPDDITDKEKGRRLKIVQEQQKLIQYNKNAAYLGQIMEVLVDEKARSRFSLSGRTGNNKIVNFDGPETLMGQIVRVEITGFGANSLKGVWIHPDLFRSA